MNPAAAASRVSAAAFASSMKTSATSRDFTAAMAIPIGRVPGAQRHIGETEGAGEQTSSAAQTRDCSTTRRPEPERSAARARDSRACHRSFGTASQVDERVEHDPDDVDEMPVERRHFVLRRAQRQLATRDVMVRRPRHDPDRR